MKKILIAFLLFASLAVNAQLKISQLSSYTGAGDAASVPVTIGGATYKINGVLLAKTRMDSIVTALAGLGVSGKVAYTDTAAMLSAYRTALNTRASLSSANTFSNSNTVQNIYAGTGSTYDIGTYSTPFRYGFFNAIGLGTIANPAMPLQIVQTTNLHTSAIQLSYSGSNRAGIWLNSSDKLIISRTNTPLNAIEIDIFGLVTVPQNLAVLGILKSINAPAASTYADSVAHINRSTGNIEQIKRDTSRADIVTALNARALSSTVTANQLLNVKYTDTTAMLAAYIAALNARALGSTVTANQLLNVKYTDTASMLAAYITALNARIKYTDSSSMLSAYRTALNARQPLVDATTDLAVNTITADEFATGSVPSAPSAGTKLYFKKVAGRSMLAERNLNATTFAHEYQPALYGSNVSWWAAGGQSTSTNVGRREVISTQTTVTQATTNLFTSVKRAAFVSASTASSEVHVRGGNLAYARGTTAGMNGFFYVCRFGVGTHNATSKTFFGMNGTNSTPVGTTVPSALTNIIGVGNDSGDGNMQFMVNDGSGTATKVDLGANFPAQTTSTDWYELRLFAPSGGATIYYSLLRINTGDFVEGSATSDLPSTSTYLQDLQWMGNGTTATAVEMDVAFVYIESEN
jgi:hypothetical protein